jgi:hypothetical protein
MAIMVTIIIASSRLPARFELRTGTSFYPNGITGKWLEAAQEGRKNWLLIGRAGT